MTAVATSVPKPKRSKRRWYLVGAFVVLLLTAPFLYMYIVGQWRERELEQIYREMDEEDPHWRWADLVKQMPSAPPDERNAMVQLQKVIVILKPTPYGNGPFAGNLPKPINAHLKDAKEQRLRAALNALAPTALAEAQKLKDMPEGRVVLDPSVSAKDVKFDALEIMKVTRVLHDACMFDAHRGKLDDAADSCLAIVHSAHAIGDFPHLLGQLVRTAVQVQAVGSIERLLGQGIVDAKQLEALQAALTNEMNDNAAFHALRGERAFGHEHYLAMRDGKISIDDLITQMRLDRTLTGQLYHFFPSMFYRDYLQALRMKNELLRASNLKDEALFDALRKIDENKPNIAGPLGGYFIGQQIVSLIVDRTRLRSAVAAIAAERYRLKHDHWPMCIADLQKEGFLKEPITDPFDGQPLRLLRTETGMLVYSIGQDKVDDHGKKGDIAFELWLPMYRAITPPPEVEAPKKSR